MKLQNIVENKRTYTQTEVLRQLHEQLHSMRFMHTLPIITN